LQSSLLGVAGKGDGDANRTVGVSDSIGTGVAEGNSVGVWVGSSVGSGLGAGESVGLAILEVDNIGAPLGGAIGADSATQATKGSVRPMKRYAFLIVAFAFYSQ
jgi:hypothetical protein